MIERRALEGALCCFCGIARVASLHLSVIAGLTRNPQMNALFLRL
jgi:hypothetical protein